jgi:dihydrofolate reductase
VTTLKAQAGRSIILDGSSQLVRTLLAHDLVDELHLLLYPLTLGRGKRLLADDAHTGFTLRSATPYPDGRRGARLRAPALTTTLSETSQGFRRGGRERSTLPFLFNWTTPVNYEN